jgi:hypothetical protein
MATDGTPAARQRHLHTRPVNYSTFNDVEKTTKKKEKQRIKLRLT